MPITPMSEILKDAKEKKYAVGSFNTYDLTTIRGVIQAAEEEHSPVILAHAPVHFKYSQLDSAANLMRYEASKAKVPVALLLDHGYDYETCLLSMKLGLNAVMMDASKLSFEGNIEKVKEVVTAARALGCDVEGEIRYVTRPISGKDEGEDQDSVVDDKSFYTRPEQAAEFVEKTNVNALAIAIGTAHGLYFKKPELDIERLKSISNAVDVPLVMHGGSGLTEPQFKSAIANGISKINYYTGMAVCAAEFIKNRLNETEEDVFYHNVMMDGIEAIYKDVGRAMKVFGSSGRA